MWRWRCRPTSFIALTTTGDSDGTLYFLPVDADNTDLLSSAVPSEQIKRSMTSIPGKLMLMLDARHSDGLDAPANGKRRAAGSLTDDLVRYLINDENGLIVMCSSTGREFSLENNEHRHGNLTLAVNEGLSGKADFNKVGSVYITELDLYVTDRVKELSRGQQHPVPASRSACVPSRCRRRSRDQSSGTMKVRLGRPGFSSRCDLPSADSRVDSRCWGDAGPAEGVVRTRPRTRLMQEHALPRRLILITAVTLEVM